jgi:DNA-binding NtrC family response regulator
LPPLRERRDDIPLLATYFAAKCCKESNRKPVGISAKTRLCLTKYAWPGNVRELQNAIERAIVLGNSDVILPEDLPEAVLESSSIEQQHTSKYHETLRDFKKDLILKTFKDANGNHKEAATLLGIDPDNLYRLIRNLGLKSLLKSS